MEHQQMRFAIPLCFFLRIIKDFQKGGEKDPGAKVLQIFHKKKKNPSKYHSTLARRPDMTGGGGREGEGGLQSSGTERPQNKMYQYTLKCHKAQGVFIQSTAHTHT